jgi:hypothetical protein
MNATALNVNYFLFALFTSLLITGIVQRHLAGFSDSRVKWRYRASVISFVEIKCNSITKHQVTIPRFAVPRRAINVEVINGIIVTG